MKPIYIDQSANELRLNLIEGYLDKKILNVLIEDNLTLCDIKIEAGIIGASHFVSLDINDTKLSEVFACLELSNAGNQCIINKVSLNKDSIKYFKKNLYCYEFSSNILDWNSNSSKEYIDFEKRVEKASNECKQLGLSYIFPSKTNNKFLAKTELIIYSNNNEIIIETLHAYPNEDKLVFTESKIRRDI